MKKIITPIKVIVSCIGLLLLLAIAVNYVGEILIPKSQNRYYMLDKYLEENPEHYLHDVQVFGSCHAYTSFDPVYLEERTGIDSFVYGNADEILPTTYVRMVDAFKKHTPKVAVVETWGINPYDTYGALSTIFGDHFEKNLEMTDDSPAKKEVIEDYEPMWYTDLENFSLSSIFGNYKERLLDHSLTDVDFNYSFEGTEPYNSNYVFEEMTSRLSYNGFKRNPSVTLNNYTKRQAIDLTGKELEIEPDIVKYVQKIIDLCRENNVELIFYRAPYISYENELRKLTHFRRICEENDVAFYDLEEELSYSYDTDFYDYHHLSEAGAIKSTEFLRPYIEEALTKRGAGPFRQQDTSARNLLLNSRFTAPGNSSGKKSFEGAGETINRWRTNDMADTVEFTTAGLLNIGGSDEAGWHLHQFIDHAEKYAGKMLTAAFLIVDHEGDGWSVVISCRDHNNQEIRAKAVPVRTGTVVADCIIPEGTSYICVGLRAGEGADSGDYALVSAAALFDGVYSLDYLNRYLADITDPMPQSVTREELLYYDDFTTRYLENGKQLFREDGTSVDGWHTNMSDENVVLMREGLLNAKMRETGGWHLNLAIEPAEEYVGKVVTAKFLISDLSVQNIKAFISCRDADDEMIISHSTLLEKGVVSVSCYVPEGAHYIRIGFFGYEGTSSSDFVLLNAVLVDDGTYRSDALEAFLCEEHAAREREAEQG